MRLLCILSILVFFSCKSDTSTTAAAKTDNSAKATQTKPSAKKTKREVAKLDTDGKVITNYNAQGIPDACDLMTIETISKHVGVDADRIFLSDGSSPQNNLSRACFFKWDGDEIKNAGVMVQLQKNPVADDVPEYFTFMVASKRTEGEKDFSGSGETFIYKQWSGFGDDGSYSTDAGKYIWRVGNDWAFMVAFNTGLSAKKQKRAAEALAREIMSRMKF